MRATRTLTGRGLIRSGIVAAVGAVLSLSPGVAVADAPVVSITSPTAATSLTYPSTVNVTGTVSHTGGSGKNLNICAVSQLRVTVQALGASEGTEIGHTPNLGNPNGDCSATSANWSFPWTPPGVGQFTITASAKHANDTGADTETVTVTSVVTVEHPAAPAVANDLLDGSLKGKKHGACISAVADHMGSSSNDQSGTDFSGVAKSNVEAYRAAVDAFLGTTSVCGGTAT